nr:hypothetical protein CFP56_45644 [Quercus suber]
MHRDFFVVNKHSVCNHRSYKASGVAGAGGLCVESATGIGAEDDDGGDDPTERPPPVLGRGDVLAEQRRWVDFHAQVAVNLDRRVRLRSQPFHWIPH